MRRTVVRLASFSLFLLSQLLLISFSYDTIYALDQTNTKGVTYEKVCHQSGILPMESFRTADQRKISGFVSSPHETAEATLAG